MDFMQLAAERYSVRHFTQQAPSREEIDHILKAGHLAPTGCNYQPQRILVMQDKESLEKLKECTKCHFDAPLAMLICYNSRECWVRKYDGANCGTVDAAIVTTHMMLAAWEIGVGSCWVMHFDPAKMREKFAIPAHIEPVALLVMGYPAPQATPLPLHDTYRVMDDVVVYNKF